MIAQKGSWDSRRQMTIFELFLGGSLEFSPQILPAEVRAEHQKEICDSRIPTFLGSPKDIMGQEDRWNCWQNQAVILGVKTVQCISGKEAHGPNSPLGGRGGDGGSLRHQ